MNTYLGALISVLVFFNIGFAFAVKFKRNDLADVLWGLGFVVAAFSAIAFRSRSSDLVLGERELILIFCVLIWAFRLAYHIGLRFFKSGHEDARYHNWRKEWGSHWLLRSYFQVFILQALILMVIALPILSVVDRAPGGLSLLVGLGVVVWVVGFIFEAVGDAQLRKFKADPSHKGQIMDLGLWSWTRHPNYFGEVVQWWGLFLMAVSLDTWWLVISPLMITFFILKVSGVTMLEELMANRPGFTAYKERTSEFIPWPPKRKPKS
jgi:steroid 5-alpha reductase family enzyme